MFALANRDNQVMIYDPKNLTMKRQHKYHKGLVRCMEFNGQNSIISGGDDHNIIIFDLNKRRKSDKYELEKRILDLKIFNRGQKILAGQANGLINVLDTRTKSPTLSFKIGNSFSTFEKINPSSFIFGDKEGKLSIYDIKNTSRPIIERNFEGEKWQKLKITDECILGLSNKFFVRNYINYRI